MQNKENEEFEKFFKKTIDLDKEFYKRFNVTPNDFIKRNLVFDKSDANYGNLRKTILDSELEDCLTHLSQIMIKYMSRYKIEARNTFSIEVHDTYRNFLVAADKFTTLLTEQGPFYEERIKELKTELDEISTDK